MLYWIKDKVAFVSADDLGSDLEHVEQMQKKFDDFIKVWEKIAFQYLIGMVFFSRSTPTSTEYRRSTRWQSD